MNNSVLIEEKFKEIYSELEKEVMTILMDESFDRKQTNLRVQPLKTTKQILENALDSIKMVEQRAKEELDK
ncbi:MAG: Unknown protein [uncultured Sulfurovum sp.]|uniref:Uncharacterized protein n=1 Tax=uncultured Sulfurovum sp. TaxID=269237 RepID=A0A6S6TQV6_9BACT|nr:MAG: Unknown protein [uncultured Sulfurovum sp.]